MSVQLLNQKNSEESNDSKPSKTDFQHEASLQQYFVPIEGYEILEQRTRFTVYKMKVEPLLNEDELDTSTACFGFNDSSASNQICWYVYRRFTDFCRLHQELKQKFSDLELELPEKSLLEKFNPVFLQDRQFGLQLYMNRLMSEKRFLCDSSVKRFLCIDRHQQQQNYFSSSNQFAFMSSNSCCQCDHHTINLLKQEISQLRQRVQELTANLYSQSIKSDRD